MENTHKFTLSAAFVTAACATVAVIAPPLSPLFTAAAVGAIFAGGATVEVGAFWLADILRPT